jgi:hypothetical protein
MVTTMSQVLGLGNLHATEKYGRTMIDHIYNASSVEEWESLSINHHSHLETRDIVGKESFKHSIRPHLSTTIQNLDYVDP